jgi:ketosteroid isomerase-like protein
MDKKGVQKWLDDYVAAWKTYDPVAIRDLYSEDVAYRDYPFSKPLVGREAVVADWLADRDDPGTYEARYEPVAVEGDAAVATGTSTYYDAAGEIASLYYNVFVMRFDGNGLCSEWTEYYVRDPRYGE